MVVPRPLPRALPRRWRRIALLCLTTACHPHLASVPVQAMPADLSAMAGRWEGDYEGHQTGRSGSIVFTLRASPDTAQGEVVMIPAMQVGMQSAGREPQQPNLPVRTPSLLTIRFVHIRGQEVLGTLDPYIDPRCGCEVTTTFHGTVAGDRVRGSFATRGQDAYRADGTWTARRVSTTVP